MKALMLWMLQIGSEQYALREQRSGHQRPDPQAEDRSESDGRSPFWAAARWVA